MDDLRERLEAALSEAQFQAQHLANDATRTARWEAHTATLREALAHPERLMGEPMAYSYLCRNSATGPVLVESREDWADSGTGLWTETPLYAPPEVKP